MAGGEGAGSDAAMRGTWGERAGLHAPFRDRIIDGVEAHDSSRVTAATDP